MRLSILIALALAIGCESKPEVQVPDGGFPPPSISAAPETKPAPKAEPEPVATPDARPADEIDEELADEAPAEPAAKARAKKRSGSVGLGGRGTSGNESGGGGIGDGSLDGLLEADAPSDWSVRLISTDSSEQAKTSQLLARRTAMLRRCTSFVGEAKRLRCDVTFDGVKPKSVKTSPANDTAGECVRAQLSKVRFPGQPTRLSFEFRR